MNGWLCKQQLDAFESALTTAHRLFTADDAWVAISAANTPPSPVGNESLTL
jgi:cupin superfamily acireductone dioxygenase involved in methionine salvage